MSLRKLFNLNYDNNGDIELADGAGETKDEIKSPVIKRKQGCLKVIAGAAAICLILSGGMAGYLTYRKAIINDELENPVYETFRTDQFEKVLENDDYKIFLPHRFELNNYLKNIRKNITQKVLVDAEMPEYKNAELVYMNIMFEGKYSCEPYVVFQLLVKCGDGKSIFAEYGIDLHNYMTSDIRKLLETDDENVRAKFPAYIYEIIKSKQGRTQVLEYDMEDFFKEVSGQVNMAGFETNWKDFFITKAYNDGKYVYIGYSDPEKKMASKVSLRCETEIVDGRLKIKSVDRTFEDYKNLGKTFKRNLEVYQPIMHYLTDAAVYDKNFEGLDKTIFDYDRDIVIP